MDGDVWLKRQSYITVYNLGEDVNVFYKDNDDKKLEIYCEQKVGKNTNVLVLDENLSVVSANGFQISDIEYLQRYLSRGLKEIKWEFCDLLDEENYKLLNLNALQRKLLLYDKDLKEVVHNFLENPIDNNFESSKYIIKSLTKDNIVIDGRYEHVYYCTYTLMKVNGKWFITCEDLNPKFNFNYKHDDDLTAYSCDECGYIEVTDDLTLTHCPECGAEW